MQAPLQKEVMEPEQGITLQEGKTRVPVVLQRKERQETETFRLSRQTKFRWRQKARKQRKKFRR